MPSATVSLPRYVVTKPSGGRADGTYRVLFMVPARLRPNGWPATIPLPREGRRTGDLTNPDELTRIVADADALNAELDAFRTSGAKVEGKRTLVALIAHWEKSLGTPGPGSTISDRTRRHYNQVSRTLAAWSKIPPVNNGPVTSITPAHIAQLLRVYDDRPTTKRHLRATLSTILGHGVEEGWLPANPVPKVQKKRRRGGKRKVPVILWTKDDVEQHVALALRRNWAPGAVMILGLWECMGRVSDAPLWRRDNHWDPDQKTLIYTTSKSDGESTAVAQMSTRFAELVAMSSHDYLVVSPRGRPYRPTLDDTRIGEHFRDLNAVAISEGGRKLILRHLRHASQTHAAECGVPLDLLRVSTTHADAKMARDKYIQESLEIARQNAAKRGIV